jgi:predicted protein tyrosine phosphatase
MGNFNRLWNISNTAQQFDRYKRVLCLCSAGLLRSPTAAIVLAGEPFNFNTRAAGTGREYALIPVDDVLINWADQIVCMSKGHRTDLQEHFEDEVNGKDIVVLNIPDDYQYRDEKLVSLIKERYIEATGWAKNPEPRGVLVKEKIQEE